MSVIITDATAQQAGIDLDIRAELDALDGRPAPGAQQTAEREQL